MERTGPRRRRGCGSRAVAAALTAVLLVGCAAPDDAATVAPAAPAPPGDAAPAPAEVRDDRPVVVATTTILGDIIGAIAGDEVEVVTLMPPGVDPHGYRASAADAAVLREAGLVVAFGLGLEESLVAPLRAVADEGGTVLAVAELVDPLEAADHDHDHDHDHEDAGGLDPHVWWDPARMAIAVGAIADAIRALPGVDVEVLDGRTEAYLADLAATDAEVAAVLAEVPRERRLLVTTHDALGYLADRYGYEVVASVIPSTSTQAMVDAASFAALADELVRREVGVVLADTYAPTTLAEALSREVAARGGGAVRVVTIHTGALGPAGSGAETYLGLLLTTARAIADALSGA